jgi:hypothetical protein
VLDRVLILLIVLLLSGLTFGLVAGHGPWAGPELVGVSPTHGVHEGDLPVLAAWAFGMICCGLLWRRR